jgi:hypothetical protein
MKQELINIEDNKPKTGKLSIALYPNTLRKTGGKVTCYYARVVNRRTLSMEDIFNDLHSDDASVDTASIKRTWNTVLNAIAMRLSSGISVDFGLGKLSPAVTGGFASEQSEFNRDRNSITVQYRPSQDMKQTMSALTPVITRGNSCRPEIIRVYDHGSDWDSAMLQEDQSLEFGTLTRGDLLIIEGKKLCVMGDGEENGLFFDCVSNPDKSVRLDGAGLCRNQTTVLECIVPAELDPAEHYRIRIVTQYLQGSKLRDEPQSCTGPTEFIIR